MPACSMPRAGERWAWGEVFTQIGAALLVLGAGGVLLCTLLLFALLALMAQIGSFLP